LSIRHFLSPLFAALDIIDTLLMLMLFAAITYMLSLFFAFLLSSLLIFLFFAADAFQRCRFHVTSLITPFFIFHCCCFFLMIMPFRFSMPPFYTLS